MFEILSSAEAITIILVILASTFVGLALVALGVVTLRICDSAMDRYPEKFDPWK